MTLFSSYPAARPACSRTIYRPFGGISGLREVHDHVGRLKVSAFPIAMIPALAPVKAPVPACYILVSHDMAYLGETGNVGRRLSEHQADPSKGFAREVYVISGYETGWFDKFAAIYLQERLTGMAEQAGLVEIVKGASPRVLDLPNCRRASFDRFVEDSAELLFDAGCRVLRSSFASVNQPLSVSGSPETAPVTDEGGQMQIGVMSSPVPGSEFELSYCELWARGYPADDGFVVMAGSEVRALVNASVNPILHTRRAELAAAGALAPISGIHDRLRLCVAVWFPSAAVAAKVVTGAHVASCTWISPRYPQPMLVAG